MGLLERIRRRKARRVMHTMEGPAESMCTSAISSNDEMVLKVEIAQLPWQFLFLLGHEAKL